MSDHVEPQESEEDALERVRIVRATQIFGDTPTDPTIGDVVVPTHDEEGATDSLAKVDAAAEDGDDEAAEASPEEAKRQAEPSASDLEEGGADVADGDSLDDSDDDEGDLTAAEKVKQIEAAESADEVDRLAEGDERVTVKRAAEKKRSSWG